MPAAVPTVTLYEPGMAFGAAVKVAVRLVALTTVTFVTEPPVAGQLTVAGEVKFRPVSVTMALELCCREVRLLEVRTGVVARPEEKGAASGSPTMAVFQC